MSAKTKDFESLMQLAGGFQAAKILMAACELDLFDHLCYPGKPAADIAVDLGLDSRAAAIFMDALTALGLLEKEGGKYSNTALAATYLVKKSPTYRGHILRHMARCWDSWSQLTQVVRQGEPAAVGQDFLYDQEQGNRDFIWGMNDVGQDRAAEVLEKLDLGGVKHMLDLGGGAATYSIAFAKQYPGLQSTVLDLPLTLKVAQENIELNQLQARIKTRPGDFFQAALGHGYDLVWISQVLHAQSESGCRQLLDKAYQALAAGGRLVIHDFLLKQDRTAPLKSSLFAVHMLAVTEGGRVYSQQELVDWLPAAGFVNVSWKQVADYTMLVEGTRP